MHYFQVSLFDGTPRRIFLCDEKQRWQAFSSGLGSLSFPAVDIITGCFSLGAHVCMLVSHIIQTFVHMGEGYFCLQTTLSLRSTKQGSIEPGLYIYIYATDLSSIYSHVPASPAKFTCQCMIFDRCDKHATLETLTHKLWKQKTKQEKPNQIKFFLWFI